MHGALSALLAGWLASWLASGWGVVQATELFEYLHHRNLWIAEVTRSELGDKRKQTNLG